MDTDLPRVSVVMVTYNHAAYIAEAIESVVRQVAPFRVELIVGEDCSTDRTREIVLEYAARHPSIVRPLLHARNLGPQRNTLAALLACRGDYVAILEGDDFWTDPEKLRLQVETMDADAGLSLCFHETIVLSATGTAVARIPEAPGGPYTLERLLRKNFIATSSVLFRRRTFPGFPDWYPEHGAAGDWLWNILNARSGRVAYLERAMSAYRMHGSSGWATQDPRPRIRSTLRTLRRIVPMLEPPQAAILRSTIRKLEGWLWLEAITGGHFQVTWRWLSARVGRALGPHG